MDEDEEVNITNDPNNSIIPLVSQNSDLLNCEYTVHPQWFLDKPSANPDCWYNNSTESSSEDQDQECLGHITTENSINDESGWTEREKHRLERGIEIFGKSSLRLSQFIGTKSSSEVRYYLKSFYNELDPMMVKHSTLEVSPESALLLENVLNESQIPCVSEEVIGTKKLISTTSVQKTKIMNKNKSENFRMKSDILLKKRNKNINYVRNKLNSDRFRNMVESINTQAEVKPYFVEKKESDCDSEEIVKIKRTLSESSDSDVDIESDEQDAKVIFKEVQSEIMQNVNTLEIPYSEVNKEVISKLSSLEIPKSEMVLEKSAVSDIENVFYEDLLLSNPTNLKSHKDYLKFRNHIITKWSLKKPNYITKTDVRKDLDLPIDNTTLSRIHTFLEQLGAINYGCSRVRYVRPLNRFIKGSAMQVTGLVHRRRFKKKFLNNGEGGCTVTHGDHGEIIDTTVVNEDPSPPKVKSIRKQPVYLIYCKPLTYDYNYRVRLNLSALLLMDFHAHSSLSEVMGLIGGTWNPETKVVSILHYEACKNVASSTTHCDMCPVSQSAAAEKIHNFNQDLLGWFHSHPTFNPEPSQQDIDTQQSLQEWIGHGKPCIGIILSPFNRLNLLTSSEYRCMVVEKMRGDEVVSPYKFKVEVFTENFDVDKFLNFLSNLYHFVSNNREEIDSKLRIDFGIPYLYDGSITYMDKFLSSVKINLEKYMPDQETIHRRIENGIRNICK